jgi:hypothetical protein
MFYTHLTLKFNPIIDNFKFPTLESAAESAFQYRPRDWIPDNGDIHWSIWKYSASEILSDKLLQWISISDLTPAHCLLFHAPAGSTLVTHLDGGGIDAWALNWAVGDSVRMNWYETTEPPTKERAYRKDEIVKEYDSTLLGNPSIVKIGIPHGASNTSSSSAWLLSLRFKTNIPYDQAVLQLSKL